MNNNLTVIPDPTTQTVITSLKSIPADSPLSAFLDDVMESVQACTDADSTSALPAVLARDNIRPPDTGYYLWEHLGRVRGDLQAALQHTRIQNPTDVETILRTVAVELVNQYNRTRSQELQATQRGRAASASESIKANLKARLLACMQRTALLREFSPDEVQTLTEHASKGNHRFAEQLAGRAVPFLAESNDWQSVADALCSIDGGGSVTASVEPLATLGNSVLLNATGTGWTLSIWADSGWMPVQASAGMQSQAKAERTAYDKLRRDSGKFPLNTSAGLFDDELR